MNVVPILERRVAKENRRKTNDTRLKWTERKTRADGTTSPSRDRNKPPRRQADLDLSDI